MFYPLRNPSKTLVSFRAIVLFGLTHIKDHINKEGIYMKSIPMQSPILERRSVVLLLLFLDGVGPIDNRPSTDQPHHFVQKKKKMNKKRRKKIYMYIYMLIYLCLDILLSNQAFNTFITLSVNKNTKSVSHEVRTSNINLLNQLINHKGFVEQPPLQRVW